MISRRNPMRASRAPACLIVISIGCGNGDENAGHAPTTTDGSTTSNAHCSPGSHYDAFAAYSNGPLANCNGYDPAGGGIDVKGLPFVRDIALDPALAAGADLAISIAITSLSAESTMEFWGSNARCGPGLEPLGTAPMTLGIVCAQLTPPSTTYSHILMVWRSEGEHGDLTLCPTGHCPNP